MDDTIIRLQEIISHLEHNFSKLSEELYTQQKELAALRHHVLQLQTQLRSALQENSIRPPDEETPPPHY